MTRRTGGNSPRRATVGALDLLLGAAATARLSRLVTQDTIFEQQRLAYLRKMDADGHPKLAELAVCPWCISVWIGAAVALAARRDVPGYQLVTSALAFSLAAGVIADLGSESA
jgi:hypothetical protein